MYVESCWMQWLTLVKKDHQGWFLLQQSLLASHTVCTWCPVGIRVQMDDITRNRKKPLSRQRLEAEQEIKESKLANRKKQRHDNFIILFQATQEDLKKMLTHLPQSNIRSLMRNVLHMQPMKWKKFLDVKFYWKLWGTFYWMEFLCILCLLWRSFHSAASSAVE